MSRPITKGSTDQSTVIRIVDATDGTPETGVTSATAGLDLKYRREGGAAVDLTESDLAAVNSTHSDGGMKHIGGGYYRVDLPDAAVATGANGVLVFGTVTGMVVIGSYHQLTGVDQYDAVRGGMTAMPNAAADAPGGLPISDAGGLDLDARLDAAVSSRMASYTQPTGFLAATFPTTVASTTNITAGTITTVTNLTNAPTSGDLTATMKTSVETAITNRIVAYNLDHLCLTATAAADMTAEVADNTIIARILANGDTSAFDPSTDGLQPIRDYVSPASTALSTAQWTNTRAGYLDNLSGGAVALQSTASAIETDTQDIQSRLPAALVSGRMDSYIGATASALIFNLTGNITGNLSGSVGSVTGAVGSVTGNVGGNVTGSVGSVVGAVGSVTGNVGGNVTGSVGSIATGGISSGSFAAGAIDAAAIAANAIGASELAADAVAEIQSGLSTLDAAGIRTAVGLASANLDTQLSAIKSDTAATLTDTAELQTDWANGGRLDLILDSRASQTTLDIVYGSTVSATGAVTTGATTTVIPTNMTPAADSYNDQLMVFTSGNLSGRAIPILSNTAGGVFTVQEAFHAAPTDGSTFNITPSHEHSVAQIQSGLATTANVAAVETDTQDIQSRLPAALVSGRMDSYIGATAASLAFNLTGNITGNLSGSVGSLTGHTAQTGDAYAVVNSGTFGNSALKSLIDTVDTVVDAIKAKTDNLPASPAAVGSAMTLADGAITEAKISTPAEVSGRPTGILGMIRRVFEKLAGGNKQTRNRTTGVVTLRNEADTATLESHTQSTSGDVDTQTKGA